jgi:hypothetical protein
VMKPKLWVIYRYLPAMRGRYWYLDEKYSFISVDPNTTGPKFTGTIPYMYVRQPVRLVNDAPMPTMEPRSRIFPIAWRAKEGIDEG